MGADLGRCCYCTVYMYFLEKLRCTCTKVCSELQVHVIINLVSQFATLELPHKAIRRTEVHVTISAHTGTGLWRDCVSQHGLQDMTVTFLVLNGCAPYNIVCGEFISNQQGMHIPLMHCRFLKVSTSSPIFAALPHSPISYAVRKLLGESQVTLLHVFRMKTAITYACSSR